MDGLLKNVDCVELYAPDLEEGLAYYRGALGMKLLWRAEHSLGLGMENGVAEIVLQDERRQVLVDFKVESVDEAVRAITSAGGSVQCGPFDIPIGRCAVVLDRWGNRYAVLDMSRGRYTTDENGNVTGVKAEQ